MKKLLITNLVTAVIVLGIIAAYSFKPEQKAGAKYATVLVTTNVVNCDYIILVTADGNFQEIKRDRKVPAKAQNCTADMEMHIQEQLEKLEEKGYQLVGTCSEGSTSSVGTIEQEKRYFTFRKP